MSMSALVISLFLLASNAPSSTEPGAAFMSRLSGTGAIPFLQEEGMYASASDSGVYASADASSWAIGPAGLPSWVFLRWRPQYERADLWNLHGL